MYKLEFRANPYLIHDVFFFLWSGCWLVDDGLGVEGLTMVDLAPKVRRWVVDVDESVDCRWKGWIDSWSGCSGQKSLMEQWLLRPPMGVTCIGQKIWRFGSNTNGVFLLSSAVTSSAMGVVLQQSMLVLISEFWKFRVQPYIWVCLESLEVWNQLSIN